MPYTSPILIGTNEKKIADGIFPAISPDGTRLAFNTVEKTSDTTYARHIAVIDVATGKLKVKKADDDDNEKPADPNPALFQLGMVVPQVHQLLDVVSTLRSVTAIAYEDDGVWVTHSETHIQDLK